MKIEKLYHPLLLAGVAKISQLSRGLPLHSRSQISWMPGNQALLWLNGPGNLAPRRLASMPMSTTANPSMNKNVIYGGAAHFFDVTTKRSQRMKIASTKFKHATQQQFT